MSHHAYEGPPPEVFKMYENKLKEQLGATGQFPEGKLTEEDEGEIRLAIGHVQGKVIMDFGEKPIKWIGFNSTQAKQIAASLLEHAEECMIVEPK